MDTPSSSSELHQNSTKTKMPLATSSGFQFSPQSARADILGPFEFQGKTPTPARTFFTGMLSDSGTESRMVSTSSDMASFSWKDYLPEMNQEASRNNLGGQSVKSNVESESKDIGDNINLKDQFKYFYGLPRTDSAQSFGSVFNLQDTIPERSKEVSKLGEFGEFRATLQENSTESLGAQSLLSGFSFREFIREVNQDVSGVKPGEKARNGAVQNQSEDGLFTFTNDTRGENTDSLSFENYINFKNQFDESNGTPVTGSVQSLGTQSPGSSFIFGEYLPKTSKELRADKLGEQNEKFSIQNLSSDDLYSGSGTGGVKTESLFLKDPINMKNKSNKAFEMPSTNSTEKLGTQTLGFGFEFEKYLPEITQNMNRINMVGHPEQADIDRSNEGLLHFGTASRIEDLKDNSKMRARYNEFNEILPSYMTQYLGTESILSSSKIDDYLPETTQESRSFMFGEQFENKDLHRQSKDDILISSSASGDDGTMFTSYEKGKSFNSTNSIGPSIPSHVGGFAFTSKYGGSEISRKELKGTRRRYIKVHRKGERFKKSGTDGVLQGSFSQGYGKTSEERRHNLGESSSFKPENIRGDANFSNPSNETTPLFSTSMGDTNINGTSFSFTEATYLDPNLFKKTSGSTILYNSSIGPRKTDRPSFFSESKYSDEVLVSAPELHYGKKNMSKIGQSSFTARSAPAQFEGPELLRSFSFPVKPHDRLRTEEGDEFQNSKKYGTSRSSGMDNEGPKWHARGKEVYEKGDMKSAEEFFTRGINSLSSGETYQSRNRSLVLCYSNRAAVRMSLGQIREALSDCSVAYKIDPTFPKVQLQTANCLVALGDLEEAIKKFNKCLESCNHENLDPVILSQASSGLHEAHKVLEYISLAEDLMKLDSDGASKALDLISDALSVCSHSNRLMVMKANALLKLRRYEDAIRYCELNPDSDGNDYISKQWRLNVIAKSYFYLGKLEEALEAIKRNEQAAVDSEWYEFDSSSSETEKEFELNENKAPEPDTSFLVTLRELARLKTAGNEAFHAGRYAEAVEHYSAAIALSTESRFFTAVCLCNRAAAYQALRQIVNAIADCSLAIALDPIHTKAFSRRAVLYDMIRDYNQEANDLRMLISLLEKQQQENQTKTASKTNTSAHLNRVHRRLLSAEDSTKKNIPLNFYLILGVDDTASEDDLKNAYEKVSLRHSPDKVIQSLPKNEKIDGDAIWIEVTGRVHKDADHLFEIIGEAYAVLSETTKRAKYDSDEEKRPKHTVL